MKEKLLNPDLLAAIGLVLYVIACLVLEATVAVDLAEYIGITPQAAGTLVVPTLGRWQHGLHKAKKASSTSPAETEKV